jgi:hypothetical protein
VVAEGEQGQPQKTTSRINPAQSFQKRCENVRVNCSNAGLAIKRMKPVQETKRQNKEERYRGRLRTFFCFMSLCAVIVV